MEKGREKRQKEDQGPIDNGEKPFVALCGKGTRQLCMDSNWNSVFSCSVHSEVHATQSDLEELEEETKEIGFGSG